MQRSYARYFKGPPVRPRQPPPVRRRSIKRSTSSTDLAKAAPGGITKALARPGAELAPGGFPAIKKTTLKYVAEISLNAGVGTASHFFSANGLFDPDITGVGHQPMGFDQWMAIYQHYTVTGCRIRMSNTGDGDTTNRNPTYYGVVVRDQASAVTGITDLLEQGSVSDWSISGTVYNLDKPNNNKVKLNVDIAKMAGKKSVVSLSEFRGDASANPTEQQYFQCFATAVQGNTSGIQGYIVEIEYDVTFTEPNLLAAS